MKSKSILKTVVLSMLIAIGVVISPILRVEGMCPMAHFINIVCSVFMGPWYSLLCAFIIGGDDPDNCPFSFALCPGRGLSS